MTDIDDFEDQPEDLDESVTDKQLSHLIDVWLADARPERYAGEDREWMQPVFDKARDALLQCQTREQAIADAARRRVRAREGQAVKRTHKELRSIAETGQLPLGWGEGDDWKKCHFELLQLPLKIAGERVRLGAASGEDLTQWQLENSREGNEDHLRRLSARRGAQLLANWQAQQRVRRVEDLRPKIDEPSSARVTREEAERRSHEARLAWEAEHLGPDGDYIELDENRAVKALEYDPQIHGPVLINSKEIARRIINAKVKAGELERLPGGMIREVRS